MPALARRGVRASSGKRIAASAGFAHRHTDVGLAALHVDLARIGQRLHRGLVDVGTGGGKLGGLSGNGGGHGGAPEKQGASDAPRWYKVRRLQTASLD